MINKKTQAPVPPFSTQGDADPQDTNLLEQAQQHHQNGELQIAESLYRSFLETVPSHPGTLHNLGVIGLQTGHVGAALKLFQCAVTADPEFADAYCNLGIALKAQGQLAEAEAAYRRAIEIHPDMAEAHSNLGVTLKDQSRLDAAAVAFEKAVAINPEYTDALSNLGIALKELGRIEEAIGMFRRAAALHPDQPELIANLGAALLEVDDANEAERILMRALTVCPDSAEINYNCAKAMFSKGDFPGAEHHFQRAIAIDPKFSDAHHNLGHVLLIQGRLTEGWREYGWRWLAKRFNRAPRAFPYPLWDGSQLSGKTILVWSEQGVGDKLLFSGLIPELAQQAERCVIETEPRLATLFRRSFPGVDVVVRKDPPDGLISSSHFDFACPMGDLPRWLRPQLENFKPLGPYLQADPELSAVCRSGYKSLGDGPIIGISWASRPPKGIPLQDWGDIFAIPGAVFVNLQYGEHAEEIAIAEADFGVTIHTDCAIDSLSDIDGFAAQVAAMDAVVTIQNATLYVASGLGIPTFAFVSPVPDWRWFGQDHSPWHETVHLNRYCESGGWNPALKKVAQILNNSRTKPGIEATE